MKVLVTFPRFGSTWIQKFINKENAINHNAKDLYDYFGKKHPGTTEEKILFLETERARGQEYSIKYFTYHEPVGTEWFTNFYKDATIIKLIRNDTYSAYLSYLTQFATGWKYHNAKKFDDLNIYDNACNNLVVSQHSIDEWFSRYYTFVSFKGYDEVLLYEDFDPSQWDSGVTSTIKYNIDYTSRISNIDHVKKEYVRCIKLLN